jgi:apoptosis-inducing factor 2
MKVTIVHGSDHLLNDTYPLKYRTALETSVRARGVELVLGDRVDNFPSSPSTPIITKNGRTINADLVLQTTGGKPQTSLVATLPSKPLSEAGYVKVKPTLQLEECPNIFAAGDIIDWVEQKQAIKAMGHAAVVVSNTLSLLAGQEPKVEYKGSKEMIAITNGRVSFSLDFSGSLYCR